jgi:hypothetical protein
MARGPVHEAFATPTAEPKPTLAVRKKPPAPLEEMPPEERPDGEVSWIAGYWAWDDDRNDYLWVSGCWRAKPPGKDWVAGYWREQGDAWQWVPGFWHEAAAETGKAKEVVYYPEPPAPPNVAPPGEPPTAESFFVPGYWSWNGERYVWHAGYWARVQPGYVWVPAHYRWTPYGYIYVAGYWDVAVARRGMLYAPVVVDPYVVGAAYVYTPVYAVPHVVVVDTLFVRPCCCHYYFGDYYGPRYEAIGFESCYVYSRRNYDSIIVYERWEHRDNPAWFSVQVNLFSDRFAGRAPLPPRTLVQQNSIIQQNITNVTNINNTTINNTRNVVNNTTNVNKTVTNTTNMSMLAPASKVAAASGIRTVAVDPATRVAAMREATAVRTSSVQQRQHAERPGPAGAALTRPRTASLAVPAASSVTRQGLVRSTTTTTRTTTATQTNPAGTNTRSLTKTQTTQTTAGQRTQTTTTPATPHPGAAGTGKLTPPSGPYGSGGGGTQAGTHKGPPYNANGTHPPGGYPQLHPPTGHPPTAPAHSDSQKKSSDNQK